MRIMLVALSVAGLWIGSAQAEQLENIRIDSRPGVTVEILMLSPEKPKAAVIMLPGGPGLARISGTSLGQSLGFMPVNFENFAAYSLIVAIVDAPSDQAGGMSPKFRQTDAHLKDLEAVIWRVRKETKLPVWLIGISRASISVLHGALNSKHSIHGLVTLSSTVRIPPHIGVTRLFELPLDRIKVPAFLGGHEDDACRGTPPGGAFRLAKGMVNSPKVVAKIFSGGEDRGRNPCGPGSPHTFEGVQEKVVDKIAEFIIVNSI